jgi:5-methylthioribose kinase
MLLHGRQPSGYRELSPSRLSDYLAALPELQTALGGRPQLWRIEQVRNNDMNLVFMVDGPHGRLCVKQAVPSVRLGDRSLAVPLERTIYEEAAFSFYRRIVSDLVPRVLHYDSEQFLLVIERLDQHRPLRQGLIEGQRLEHLAERAGTFLAASLFATSDLGMAALEKRERLAFFCGNNEMRNLSEELIFIEPFTSGTLGSWLAPELDAEVLDLRGDADLKRAVAELHLKFLSEPQALLHGDLHTGSIMVSASDLKVIDPEFAGFGPMGFDIGLLLGDLLIAYFSQEGHARADAPRDGIESWLLGAAADTWTLFSDRFIGRWRGAAEGDALPPVLFDGPGGDEARRELKQAYMRRLFEDSLRFAGLEMVRRILGRRPVSDFTTIAERARRATSERKTLLLGRELIKSAQHVTDMAHVIEVARQIRAGAITHA